MRITAAEARRWRDGEEIGDRCWAGLVDIACRLRPEEEAADASVLRERLIVLRSIAHEYECTIQFLMMKLGITSIS